jgi:hypothetical protein
VRLDSNVRFLIYPTQEKFMARIYKRTDRLTLKIDDITLKLAPLSMDQKNEIQTAMTKGRREGDAAEAAKGVCLSIRYSVKGIEGLEDGDGNPYKLTFDVNDNLSDECLDDLLNLELNKKLALVCAKLTNCIPSEFTDENGEPMTGVEIVKAGTPVKND